jgi:large subunit ribosomal protein L23
MNPYIIKQPLITEKTLRLANTQNTYTFEVDRNANKAQIKAAIENLFNVKVQSVNTVMKARTFKKTGRKRVVRYMPRVKKALVKLKKGSTIDLFDIGGQS